MSYDHQNIDPKWQKRWADAKIFEARDDTSKEKYYLLVEFPYPSGAGLHVGHPRSYTALDVLARKRRMEGKNVLFPMGWDAFGLPAENYAIKTGVHPSIVTKENIATFRKQLQSIGFSFDWSREVDTTDPKYYRWTQWMFLEFFKQGLCYKAKMAINWCPSCKIGLANEEAAGGVCERCGGPVEKKEKEQWMIAMTKYADRLLEDLKDNDYLPKIKKEQEEWIGRSEGAEIDFVVDGYDEKITVFTTRPDTVFGVTYVVLAPEHSLVARIVTDAQRAEVDAYVAGTLLKTDDERGDVAREKTGVFTGAFVVNPVNGEKVPVWVADYVLGGYGTGAVMAVPAHDERDRVFALKYGDRSWFKLVIEIGGVINPDVLICGSPKNILDSELDHIINYGVRNGRGYLVNSENFNGISSEEACKKIVQLLESKNAGRKKTTYRLRDWVFSRQRYWGEPIPLVKCASGCGAEHGGWVPVPDSMLPVELPQVEKYEPTDTGESPLSTMADFVNTKCPQCGGPAVRETDTMPNWAGSSWYFLRYIDAHNDEVFAKKELLKYWLPVDLYNGGMEHATRHLLYARFWTKVLFDRGHIPCTEFAKRRIAHGMILGEGGMKMSKSKGNVINPDDIVKEFGADTLRMYELFMGPFDEAVPWSTNGVIGVRRFLDKKMPKFIDSWIRSYKDDTGNEGQKRVMKECEDLGFVTKQNARLLNVAIKKVSEDVESLRFNTAISTLMKLINDLREEEAVNGFTRTNTAFTIKEVKKLLIVLCPFAPHLANELWEKVCSKETGILDVFNPHNISHDLLEKEPWPSVDASLLVDDVVTYAVQVNGKVRGNVSLAVDATDEVIIAAAKVEENVAKYLVGNEPKKVIIIPKKIVSFVV